MMAEILLQRTKRKQVVEIYHILINKYPTARDLAMASEKEIQRIIHSLGLSKRARYLIESARYLTGESSQPLGLGEYSRRVLLLKSGTSAPLPVDRNVARVIERYFGISVSNKKRPDKDTGVLKISEKFSGEDPTTVLHILWGLLDISEEFCLSKKPRCRECPLREECVYIRTLP